MMYLLLSMSQAVRVNKIILYHNFQMHLFSAVAQGCGGVLNSTQGTMTSLDANNDGNYEPNLECIWRIYVPMGKRIKLTFSRFNIESSPSNMSACSYDYLEVTSLRYFVFIKSIKFDGMCLI